MNHTCQAQSGGLACLYTATLLEPVRLCDEHKFLVASAVFPDLLAAALREVRAANSRQLPPDLAHLVSSAQAAPMPTTDPHSALVYFMANGGRVKIGYTKSLFSRVQALSLRDDAILLLLHGGTELERALHAKFGAHRVGDTEWFELSPEIVHFISRKGPNHRDGTAPRGPRPQRRPRVRAGQRVRRSMEEWVRVAGPVFHAEVSRLHRNPKASEFAAAIKNAGLGTVSDSTAKSIRTEVLDRDDSTAQDLLPDSDSDSDSGRN